MDQRISELTPISSGSINSTGSLIELVQGINNYKTTPKDIVQSTLPISIDSLTIISSGSTASNVGLGEGEVYKEKVGNDLRFRTIKAGTNITVTNDSNEITINSTASGSTSGSLPSLKSFVLSEDMEVRDLAVLQTNGQIRKIQYSAFGSPYEYFSGAEEWNSITSLTDSLAIIRYKNTSSSTINYIPAIVSGYDVSFGSSSVSPFNETNNVYTEIKSLDNNHFVVCYKDTVSTYVTANIGTVTGVDISFSTGSIVSTNVVSTQIKLASLDSTHFIVCYRDITQSQILTKVGTVTGTSITFGSSSVVYEGNDTISCVTALDNTHVIVGYRKSTDTHKGFVKYGTIGEDSITFGAEAEYDNSNNTVSYSDSITSLNSSKFVILYNDNDNSDRATCKVGSVLGTSITFGAEVPLNANSNGSQSPADLISASSDTQVVLIYRQSAASKFICTRIGLITGTSISLGVESVSPHIFLYPSVAHMFADNFIIAYSNGSVGGDQYYGKAIVGSGDPTQVSDRIFGILQEGGSSGSVKKVATFGEVSEVHTSLIPGRLYYYNTLLKNDVTLTANNYLSGFALSSTELKIVSY
jgi:hypothetical protein